MTKSDYTKVPHAMLEALSHVNLRAYEWRVLMVVIRETIGWHRYTWHTSLVKIAMGAGLERRNTYRTLNTLQARRMIKTRPEKQGLGVVLVTDVTRWREACFLVVDNPEDK